MDEESVAPTVTALTALPDTDDSGPGAATVTVLVTVQVNEVEPVWPAESVAPTVTV